MGESYHAMENLLEVARRNPNFSISLVPRDIARQNWRNVGMRFEPGKCPLCGNANECQLASTDAYQGPCWCAKETFPPELLARIPDDARNVTCVCRRCVIAARFASAKARPLPKAGPGDFYMEGHSVVFTPEFHRRRGYCCGSGCRHCPFDPLEREIGGCKKPSSSES